MLSSLQTSYNLSPRCWFFPSSFATEILFQCPMDHITQMYQKTWMPETSDLEHVFVPICEPPKIWHLLLLDIKRGNVYGLDVCQTFESIPRREKNMQLIMVGLAHIFKLDRNIANFQHVSPDPNTWGPIEFPVGIPNKLGSDESGIWCIWWLSHHGRFSPCVFGNLGDEATLRMKSVIRIVSSDFNDFRGMVDLKAESILLGFPSLP